MWVDQILSREADAHRFEAFAVALTSVLEGRPIVQTSRSWDLGRDGRGVGSQHGVFVLATLRTDVAKPLEDARRLKTKVRIIKRVYYVAARLVSEEVLEKHRLELQKLFGNKVQVDPIGGRQISDLVSNGQAAAAFAKHYAGELGSITAALGATASDPHAKHLELALATFGADNTQQLRHDLTSRLILGLLQQQPLSSAALVAGAARVLGVAAFSDSAIKHYCANLERNGQIAYIGREYTITNGGREKLAEGDVSVVNSGLYGIAVVRNAVEDSLSRKLPDQQWNSIWTALQEKLAYAFYIRGKQILDVISALLKGDGTSAVQRNALSGLVEEVLRDVIDEYVAKPHTHQVLRAFQDAFLPGDRHGAFEWLAGVAGRFAATCTLGLPSEVASTLTKTLKKIRCFFDTDIVVSYLCAHEPGHVAAHAFMDLSKRLETPVMVTEAVAEETARHAMKAYTDYRVRVASVTGKLEWYEIADLESAFTREFAHLRLEGKIGAGGWLNFIGRYAGEETRNRGPRQQPNITKMRRVLSGESFAIRAPKDSGAVEKQSIETTLYEDAMRRQPDANAGIVREKARIDAEMLVTVAQAAAEAEGAGTGERYIVVTSASRLRSLPNTVRVALREPPEVISLAEAGTIASLLPEHPVSLRALHSILFEVHFARTVGRLESLLLRIVRESSSAVVPGATRGVVCEEFGTAILREAKRTGETASEVRERIGRNPVELARIAAAAVDALALTHPIEREEVLRRIEDLSPGPSNPSTTSKPAARHPD